MLPCDYQIRQTELLKKRQYWFFIQTVRPIKEYLRCADFRLAWYLYSKDYFRPDCYEYLYETYKACGGSVIGILPPVVFKAQYDALSMQTEP